MRIFVSAAEISSDLHAEKVIRALIAQFPNQIVEIFGIGGPRVRALPNFKSLEHAENLRAMGIVEVVSKIKKIKTIRDRVLAELKTNPPDLAMTFDYPDFHFSLMREWSRDPSFQKALRICGIPPKVWVWRSHRVERIRALYHGVWVIFPFEKKFYESHRIPVIYEGNPLIADWITDAPPAQLTQSGVLKLAVMPGSREAELKYHLPMIPETLERLADLSDRKILAEVPIPAGVESDWIKRELVNTDQVAYEFFHNGTLEVLRKNAIGLIKSGTSTLEAAVLGCVPVIFYKVHPISEYLFKIFVRYSGPVGLPNILLGVKKRTQAIFTELIGRDADEEAMALELWRLVQNREAFEEKRKLGMSLRASLVPHSNVSETIAKKIATWIKRRPYSPLTRTSRFSIAVASFVWSTINACRRALRDAGFLRTRALPLPSILVGNLQAGGAGKTPIVIELAREAVVRGFRVGIISRGYKGRYVEPCKIMNASTTVEESGDEAYEIYRAVPQAKVALSRDRHLAAEALKREGVNLLILDDGFQNLKFTADETLLLVTDAKPSQLLYRDFARAAQDADFVLQTKGPPTSRFGSIAHVEWSVGELPTQPVWLLCGLADPHELVEFYRERGLNILRVIAFPDHVAPDQGTVKTLIHDAQKQGARVMMTEKDWVKIEHFLNRDEVTILKRTMKSREWLNPLFERLQRVVETRKL